MGFAVFRMRSSTEGMRSPCMSTYVESAFGSHPICMTVYPRSANTAARLDTVVDFPMPPFPYTAILNIASHPFPVRFPAKYRAILASY